MKYTKKNRSALINLIILGSVAGTLFWAVLQAAAELAGFGFKLEIGPVGFDLHLIALWIRINPGTFLGAGGGYYLFHSL